MVEGYKIPGIDSLRSLEPPTRRAASRSLRSAHVCSMPLLDRQHPSTRPWACLQAHGPPETTNGVPNAVVDPFLQRAITAGTVPTLAPPPGGPDQFAKLEVDGSSKIPSMRNVALTPPYFSWGGYPSLRQALKVYNRGMNRRDITADNTDLEAHGSHCTSGDNSGSGPNGDHSWPVGGNTTDCNTNTTGLIVPLGLSDCDPPIGSVPRQACDTFIGKV
jgi:hypothetical protein